MIAADTNLIIRFLVRDEEDQAQKVKSLMDDGDILFINQVVLSELYWVLIYVYEYSKNDFVIAIDALLDLSSLRFFDKTVVAASLAEYIHSDIGFVDCLIHQINKKLDIPTLTFDPKASRLERMQLLS